MSDSEVEFVEETRIVANLYRRGVPVRVPVVRNDPVNPPEEDTSENESNDSQTSESVFSLLSDESRVPPIDLEPLVVDVDNSEVFEDNKVDRQEFEVISSSDSDVELVAIDVEEAKELVVDLVSDSESNVESNNSIRERERVQQNEANVRRRRQRNGQEEESSVEIDLFLENIREARRRNRRRLRGYNQYLDETDSE